MLIECSIVKYLLDRRDRELASCLTLHFVSYLPGNIYRCKGCVVAEGETFGCCGLPVLKSCILLCIAEQELNLEPGVIYLDNVGSAHCGVGAEENLSDGLAAVGEFGNRHLDLAFERLAFDNCTEDCQLDPVNGNCLSDEDIVAKGGYVHHTVQFLLPSASALLWAGIKILQHSIVPKSADHIESECLRTLHKIETGKKTVADEYIGNPQKIFPVVIALRHLAVWLSRLSFMCSR